MKKLLIAIVILAYGGFTVATVKFAVRNGRIDYQEIFLSILLIIVNRGIRGQSLTFDKLEISVSFKERNFI